MYQTNFMKLSRTETTDCRSFAKNPLLVLGIEWVSYIVGRCVMEFMLVNMNEQRAKLAHMNSYKLFSKLINWVAYFES